MGAWTAELQEKAVRGKEDGGDQEVSEVKSCPELEELEIEIFWTDFFFLFFKS